MDWSFTEETDLLKWFQRGKGNAHVIIAGDNVKEILAVRDNVILAEPNDIGTEFAATVTAKYRILIQRCFYAQITEKPKTRGLNRHQSTEHGDYTKTYEERLPLHKYEQFLTTSKVNLTNDQSFKNFMREISAFVIDKECIKNVHKLISHVLSFNGDTEKFYLAFYKCISMRKILLVEV